MTPSARIAAVIALVADVDATPRRPADATANDFFRGRRYIGSGDRRAVAERAWGVLRQRLRLSWHLLQVGLPVEPRHLVMAHLVLAEGWNAEGVEQGYPGGRFNPPPLDQGERKLIDSSYLFNSSIGMSNDPLRYEKRLLDDWVRREFRGDAEVAGR